MADEQMADEQMADEQMADEQMADEQMADGGWRIADSGVDRCYFVYLTFS
jgi:hypothetical protein